MLRLYPCRYRPWSQPNLISQFSTIRHNSNLTLPNKQLTIAKFNFPLATHTVAQLHNNLAHILHGSSNNSRITLNGHINRKPRIRSSLSFAELRDKNGDLIQLIMNNDLVTEDLLTLMKHTTIEDSVSVTGIVKLKEQKDSAHPQQIELLIENYQILNSSNLDASRLDKLKHESPGAIPPQFRYLTLRTKKFQELIRLRSKISQMIRNILIENHEFVEIETPLLFKSTPEGAREFLVPTRLQPKKFYALPQSPQQYKQILMSSGFTRYFQLAKCFRDEDLRQDRQPEFTQVDMEMSYITSSDQVGLVVEDLIHSVVNKLASKSTYKINVENDCLEKIEFTGQQDQLQFSKMKYIDCLQYYGIDKPDLRYNHKLINLSMYFTSSKKDFPVIECLILRNFTNASNNFKIPHSITNKIHYSKRVPYTISIKNDQDRLNWYQKFVDAGVLHPTHEFKDTQLNQLLNLNVGDVIAFSNRAELPYENPTPLGKVRQLVIENFPDFEKRKIFNPETSTIEDNNLSTNDIFVGSWVVEFPLFNPLEIADKTKLDYPVYDFDQFESTHHPFTMPNTDDYDYLQSDPLKVRGEHYDLVINGSEVGGGSRRVHDPSLQTFIFKKILGINNYEQKFGHLLKALSMGCPPHAGLALGFDRLVAILAGTTNLRDVIAFPKNQSGIDPVVDSPTEVSKDILQLYHINTIEKEDDA